MSDPLLDPIFERIDRAQQAGMRLGTVTEIDVADASLTVSLAGDMISGVRWIASYSPVVGELVLTSRVDAVWVVLGKLSKQLGVAAPPIYGMAVDVPALGWFIESQLGAWSWTPQEFGLAGQGTYDTDFGSVDTLAGVWSFLPVSASLPEGATVISGKLRMTRWYPTVGAAPESSLVTPRLRMHTYTESGGTSAPVWTGTAWSPGTLARSQIGSWDLPSTWLTALLSGASMGVGVTSEARADYTRFSNVQIEISYSTPAL